jgi:hypothetical protein
MTARKAAAVLAVAFSFGFALAKVFGWRWS